MANIRITQLPTPQLPISGSELVPVVQNGQTVQTTVTAILNSGSIGVTSFQTSLTGLTPATATGGVVTLAGTLGIASGGTGQTTKTNAFNALSPITTTGDLIVGSGTNTATRLPIGAANYILTSNGTTAVWSAPSAGGVSSFSAGTTGLTPNSATTGAITLGGTLAIANGGTGNTSGQAASVANALTINNSGTGAASGAVFNGSGAITISYNTVGASPLAGSTSLTTVGTIATGTWNATNIALNKGGTNASLTATAGGIVYSGASALAISAAGTTGQVLTSNGAGAPTWSSATTGTVTSVSGTGTVNGITLTGTVTNSGSLTLGGTLSGISLTTQVSGILPIANGGTNASSASITAFNNITGYTASGATGTTSTNLVFSTNPSITNPTVTNYVETQYSANTGSALTIVLTNGTVQNLTLTNNTTLTMPTAEAGKSFILFLKTGSGGFSVTWSTVVWPGGTAPTITSTASKQDIYSFFSDGTDWYGVTVGQNYTP